MGMAAGQARLLSITARINHNELRAQQITNAKLRLSDSTQEASDEYIKALNDTELKFISYDASGNKTTSALTGNSLSYYGELKNQYGLINAAGQIMVSELDGYNFETSDTLEEFLDKYGLLGPEDQGKIVQVKNPEYDTIMGDYYERYENWKASEPKREDFIEIVEVPSEDNELYQKFINTGGCLGGAIGGSNCYMHVLSDAIGPGVHTTSDGIQFEVVTSGGWNWNSALHGVENFEDVTEGLKNANCSGYEVPGGSETVTTSYGTVTVGGPPSDPNMTVYQRAVDLLWLVHGDYDGSATGGTANPEHLQMFWYFVEHDLKQLAVEEVEQFDEEGYQTAYDEWLAEEPKKPEVEMYIDKVIRQLTDNDKGQWYINLWHRMNGESDFKSGYMNDENYTEDMGWISDSKTNENYVILEDGLMNSPEWLEFALKNGIITIEQVQFSNPTEEGMGLADVTWTSIEYTSITDISEQSNEVARTKAEVKYNTALKEIEAKDKQYDTDLKNLDTEHSALQTEYDSIKSTIDKNVERSFKAFS